MEQDKKIEFPGGKIKKIDELFNKLLNVKNLDDFNNELQNFNQEEQNSIKDFQFGIFKDISINSEFTDLALKLKNKEISQEKYFDILLFNYTVSTNDDEKPHYPLIILLKYCEKNSINQINKETLKEAFKECGYFDKDVIEKTNWEEFINLLKHTSYINDDSNISNENIYYLLYKWQNHKNDYYNETKLEQTKAMKLTQEYKDKIVFPGNSVKEKDKLLKTLLEINYYDENGQEKSYEQLKNDLRGIYKINQGDTNELNVKIKKGFDYRIYLKWTKLKNMIVKLGVLEQARGCDFTDLALKLKNKEISQEKYFDILLFNYVSYVKTKTYNPLIILLKYCEKNSINQINKETLEEAFKECGYFDKDVIENTNWEEFINLLKHTSYINEDNNEYHIETTKIDNLLKQCNYGFHNKKNYLYTKILKKGLYLTSMIKDKKRKKIYFGAPGTGKSYKLDKNASGFFIPDNIKNILFRPSYSYSDFVGVYKPKKEKNKTVFDFIPGPLINILIKAYENPEEDYLLVIEEINRANVSEVFGDFFQLIERNKDGRSQYDISVSEDLKIYLNQEKSKPENKEKLKNLNPEKLYFPSNLYIWATMNSSDQGTFPLDTAFKRRWDFEYIGIDDNEEEVEKVYFKLPGDDDSINWNDFRKLINKKLLEINSTINEDKLLGPFFIGGNLNDNSPEDNTEIIKNKVVPYLYEDVLKYLGREAINKIFNPKLKTLSEIIKEFNKENAKLTDIFLFSNKEIEDNANNSNSNNNATITESQNN